MAADKTEDADKVEAEINEYLADVLPNTTVEITWVSFSEWAEKWSKAMSAQEQIDLAWMGWLNSVETEVSMGSLMPIDDLLAEYGSEIVDTLSQPVVEKHRSLDGNLYFLPAWQGMIGGRMGLYLPHEIVELAGEGWAENFQKSLYETWKLPYFEKEKKNETIAYLEQYLAAAKEADKLGLGLYVRNNPILQILASNTDNLNGISISQVGDTYYLEAISSLTGVYYNYQEIYHDFYTKGYVREDVASVEVGDVKWSKDVPLAQSYVSYCHNGFLDNQNDTYTTSAGFQIDGFYIQEECELTNGYSTGAVIPATSENPERAMMLLNLLYTDVDLYHLFVYGVEGTHYTKNNDGTITIPENVTYKGPQCWQVGTCLNAYQTDPAKLDYYTTLKAKEETAILAPLDGFTFDKEPVSVELSNIDAINAEYSYAYTNDNWDELLKERRDKLIAAGIEAVLKEMAKQLTPYAQEKGMKVEIIGY